MKRQYLIALGLTLALSAGVSATRASSEVDGETAMPGAVHKQLAKRAGEYTTVFNDENGVKQTFDAALRHVDEDHFVVGLYARGPDGSRGPTFDTTYTRKK